ncbi:MAG TPA: glutathione-regulated potassium-efflux system protein KefC [Polyangiales bacterium]
MSEHSLLVDALIYLAAAVICVPILTALGLGSVLGYLVAGCLIGPSLLGFVRDVHAIMHVAELGVVLMLFVIGLELDPKRLWELRSKVFGGGALQLGACVAVLFPGGMLAGLEWRAALVAALAVSLSSTAIAMQTMGERNLVNAPLGRTTFGVLLFQDLAAIPIMGAVSLLSASGEGASAVDALKGVAAIVLVVGVGRYLTRPALRAVAKTHQREVFTAFALLLVMGIAQVMALAGLSMALGAFLAGVLLASSEYRRALETDIEPFKGLLLGLFFMSVGMSIDLALLREQPLLVAALLLGFQVAKFAALWLVGRLLGVAASERPLFAALIAQGGEFAFVVFGVARQAGSLDSTWEPLLTLTVALSMALTPLLLIAVDRISARYASREQRADDEIDEHDAQVIIAGFGRVGQIVGRLLLASGLRATVLDHDPDQVESLRRFGFRVYYGDATRLDLLHTAGADKALLLVNAIDDIEDNLELTDLVREHFPKLRIVARARNVTHYSELKRRGVELVERETFEAALLIGRRALESLDVAPYEAKERVDAFRRHNIKLLDSLIPHFADENKRMSLAKAGREELERQFEQERAALARPTSHAWRASEEDA